MAEAQPPKKRIEDPHVETKSQRGKRLTSREKKPNPKRREEIQANGSDWVVVTEVRIKYEVQTPDGPQTYEVYIDPGKINSIHFDQIDCNATRGALDLKDQHIQLAPDGSNNAWGGLVDGKEAFATRPQRAERGRYHSSHGPLCFHEDTCTFYCVCGPIGLIGEP